MTRPIIVFDLDGTLVDTAPDLLDSVNHVLEERGLMPIDPARLRDYVGHGGRVLLKRAHEAQGGAVSEGELDALVPQFVARYGAGMPGQSKPFDGAVACMDRFEAAGFALAVCTNKMEGLSHALLKALGLYDRFAAICGADSFAVKKPDPGHLTGTIERAEGDRQNAIMIGDSITDIDTAKAAGIPVVAVDFGYSTKPVRGLGPDQVISHFDELTVAMAERLIAARKESQARSGSG